MLLTYDEFQTDLNERSSSSKNRIYEFLVDAADPFIDSEFHAFLQACPLSDADASTVKKIQQLIEELRTKVEMNKKSIQSFISNSENLKKLL